MWMYIHYVSKRRLVEVDGDEADCALVYRREKLVHELLKEDSQIIGMHTMDHKPLNNEPVDAIFDRNRVEEIRRDERVSDWLDMIQARARWDDFTSAIR